MQCANPECRLESNYLRGGALYGIEDDSGGGDLERERIIWLCARCVEEFTVERWRPAGQQLRRRWTAGASADPPAGAGYIRPGHSTPAVPRNLSSPGAEN